MFKLRKNMERPLTSDEVDTNFLDLIISSHYGDFDSLCNEGHLFVNSSDVDFTIATFDDISSIGTNYFDYVTYVDGVLAIEKASYRPSLDGSIVEILGVPSIFKDNLIVINDGVQNNLKLVLNGLSYDFIYFKQVF